MPDPLVERQEPDIRTRIVDALRRLYWDEARTEGNVDDALVTSANQIKADARRVTELEAELTALRGRVEAVAALAEDGAPGIADRLRVALAAAAPIEPPTPQPSALERLDKAEAVDVRLQRVTGHWIATCVLPGTPRRLPQMEHLRVGDFPTPDAALDALADLAALADEVAPVDPPAPEPEPTRCPYCDSTEHDRNYHRPPFDAAPLATEGETPPCTRCEGTGLDPAPEADMDCGRCAGTGRATKRETT